MNIQQFAALKVGDKIDNAMSQSRGEVVTVDKTGVRVRWDGVGEGAGTIRHYSAQSTIWFHWSKDEPLSPELDKVISDELAHPPASIMKEV